jgi:hypothetical protein
MCGIFEAMSQSGGTAYKTKKAENPVGISQM